MPDTPIIAVASVGDGLGEDVLFELRRVLASGFDAEIVTVPGIPLPSSPTTGCVANITPREGFRTGGELVAKLRRFRHEGARRLVVVAECAQTEECRSVFLRRYFGEEQAALRNL